MKLKKGDKVRVMIGKDRGKEAAVEKMWPEDNRVTLAGINVYKRHSKPRGEGQKGGIVDFVRPLPVANVALICSKCKQPTRVGYKITAKEKIRVCRKCGQEI
ncbi:MAG: 50S ribosomal protein L24 [Patescibacteria group bacterium]|nr:50S ribosomal protein L24 [Patescibacteria group bacterium]MCL5432472.1 50S ribosomal protein L24 [Patescibacteria group bacterium]